MPVAKSTLKVRPQQQLSDKKLKEILEEDKRRLTSLLATYRPITGENAPGLRFECVIEDFLKGKKLWLPVEMLKEKKFCAIIKCGSISAFCEKYMADLDQEKARDAVFRYLIRLRCKHDFYFFAYAYARIKNKDGGDDIPFLLNHAQIGLTKDFERQRLHGELHSILIILLKCRQWGGSTDTEVYMFWIQMFWKTNWNSNIIGHQSSSATQTLDIHSPLLLVSVDGPGHVRILDVCFPGSLQCITAKMGSTLELTAIVISVSLIYGKVEGILLILFHFSHPDGERCRLLTSFKLHR